MRCKPLTGIQRTDKVKLKVLHLAATQGKWRAEAALELLLVCKATITVHAAQQILEDPVQNPSVMEVPVYYALLQTDATLGVRTMNTMPSKELERALVQGLRALRMPGVRNSFLEAATLARQESMSVQRTLLALWNRNSRVVRTIMSSAICALLIRLEKKHWISLFGPDCPCRSISR
ncbi:MAG: hypothetical protein F4058_04310 [Rhodothermaceae bacterium]|nr:hypothetical protein [Rhodothermaceae bacterium]MYF62887.1 hypothetical protein [Rhodothermaceae bacterium]MYI84543.1 hypothetical protein [Rhodothermaceae bacterium]